MIGSGLVIILRRRANNMRQSLSIPRHIRRVNLATEGVHGDISSSRVRTNRVDLIAAMCLLALRPTQVLGQRLLFPIPPSSPACTEGVYGPVASTLTELALIHGLVLHTAMSLDQGQTLSLEWR